MADTAHKRLNEETEEEVRMRRGTPNETIERIREKYSLPREFFSEFEIFFMACKYYYTEAHALERAKPDFQTFVEGGRAKLPEYVYRCGDPDVDYPCMHAY